MIEPRVIDSKESATVYSPPQHAAGTVHATKLEANAAEQTHAATR